MELRLLGPLDGRVLDTGMPKRWPVFAALAAEAGQPIGVESPIDQVWGSPPEQARRTLHIYLSRIRRTLADPPGHWAQRVWQAWQREHLDAVVAWAQASLEAGDPSAVLPRQHEQLGEHPLIESMGRYVPACLERRRRSPADALDHYTTIQCSTGRMVERDFLRPNEINEIRCTRAR